MHAATFLDVLSGLVFVALITTIVAHPNTAKDITAAANGFSGALKAAKS